MTLRNIEPEFAEPFVSAVREISVEDMTVKAEVSKENAAVVSEQKIADVKVTAESKEVTPSIGGTSSETSESVDVINAKETDADDLSFKGQELLELSRNVINCLGHISENYFFGISVLISVLRGGKRKQIVKHHFTEVPEYGIYADMSRDDMRAVVQWMINNHYMLKTKEYYPVLHPTYNGNHFDECITKKQLRDLKKYLEDPNREIFADDNDENTRKMAGSYNER